MSSTLTKLKINVKTLDDSLYFLDEHLYRLSTFIIHVTNIIFKLSNTDNTVRLYIFNDNPSKNKQYSSTLIIFPHLIILDLRKAHLNYAKQFLFEKNTHLPR
ncbi:unnamed protein product [Rotaria sp. Silwood2]|nr:unnamed protein product [Rotaria sp. Silwood2]CAF2757363.1 unnamed protein product [Rotaria sp. Silwood2]CAF3155112.1 unnamed protein product [Rotaria sp. Silwood2]CAF3862179.1 unnamed protein product [Rotaria sp. Silwood2]CAF3927690.1 unnamed protein product [Rotaria sp. Silwood2]